MEKAKDYIESGILELYVLGQLTVQEQKEVEEMASAYPEIREEISAIEVALEGYAIKRSIAPRRGLDQHILSDIQNTSTTQPAETIVKPLTRDTSANKIRTLSFALAACIALLIVSVVALISAHNNLNTAQQQIASLNLEKQKFTSTVGYMKQTNADLQKIADMVDDPNWAVVKMAGTKAQPGAKMMVYWNKKNKDVMVDRSKTVLPENDLEHQYQLWALVDGKPVDLGVFDVKTGTASLLLKMKEIPKAQAFAVTLEKRGGSEAPTMDQMFVMGGVSI